jgi:hypothetical protein
MSDEDMPSENAALDAPPELVNDLRQLQKERLLVPPQIDAAALGRSRLHLARIRGLRAHRRATPTAAAEDLALAAHASTEQERRAQGLAPHGTESPELGGRRPWTLLRWATLIAAVAVIVWLFLRWLLWR